MHFRPALGLLLPLLGLTATASPLLNARSAEPTDAETPVVGCSDMSFKTFGWEARAFDFHASYIFTTPAHQNSWGYASFDLFNPADESTARCEASSSQLSDFFYGTVQYKCNDTLRNGATSFDFSRPANQLRVNQTWTCADQDPQWPITFTGRGQANLTLDCTDETWENPDWEMGQIYSSRNIDCGLVDSRVVPIDLSAVA
ncbi:hypothetical protein C8A00DRAFT_36523 [Chaetomidium leptoderma]|uniref:AA1-like domain-containing protein n=1 Tax=Chaetomidium leptoderma TaxID=669021 RepID=A0AAN6VHB4_9PEZI|nr:hypothetical protein C8A00DRAFT_36523 [Chaetomidium leptoderma]